MTKNAQNTVLPSFEDVCCQGNEFYLYYHNHLVAGLLYGEIYDFDPILNHAKCSIQDRMRFGGTDKPFHLLVFQIAPKFYNMCHTSITCVTALVCQQWKWDTASPEVHS